MRHFSASHLQMVWVTIFETDPKYIQSHCCKRHRTTLDNSKGPLFPATKVKALYRRAQARIGPASAVDGDRDAAIQAMGWVKRIQSQRNTWITENRYLTGNRSQQIVKDIASWTMIACIFFFKRNPLTLRMAVSLCRVPLDGKNKRESFWTFSQLDSYILRFLPPSATRPDEDLLAAAKLAPGDKEARMVFTWEGRENGAFCFQQLQLSRKNMKTQNQKKNKEGNAEHGTDFIR